MVLDACSAGHAVFPSGLEPGTEPRSGEQVSCGPAAFPGRGTDPRAVCSGRGHLCHAQALCAFDAPVLFENCFLMSWLEGADRELRDLIMGLAQVSRQPTSLGPEEFAQLVYLGQL